LVSYIRERIDKTDPPDYEKVKSEVMTSLRKTMEETEGKPVLVLDEALISERFSLLDDRVRLIESSISQSPEKALSIPLLRRDLEELERKFDEYKINSKIDADRLWSQQNTILQGIGALLLAVAAAAVTILYKAIRPSSSKN